MRLTSSYFEIIILLIVSGSTLMSARHCLEAGYVIVRQLVEGIVLGLINQLAHVMEETDFPGPNAAGNRDDAGYYLYLKVYHIHNPAVSKIVRTTALEFSWSCITNRKFYAVLNLTIESLVNLKRGLSRAVR